MEERESERIAHTRYIKILTSYLTPSIIGAMLDFFSIERDPFKAYQ